MAPTIWEVFRKLLQWGEEPKDRSGDEDDGGRFVPSPLDLSVRIGHGGPDDDIVEELSEVDEQARDLEENRPGR